MVCSFISSLSESLWKLLDFQGFPPRSDGPAGVAGGLLDFFGVFYKFLRTL